MDNENIGVVGVPVPEDFPYHIEEINNQRILVVGHGDIEDISKELMLATAKKENVNLIMVDDGMLMKIYHQEYQVSEYDKYLEFKLLPTFPMMIDAPNKLKMLKNLNLSESDIRFILESPESRIEGEDFESYKNRKQIKKLLVKYRNSI